MSRLLLIIPAVALVSTAAVAADLPTRRVEPIVPIMAEPAFSYTGFYAGVNGGYGKGAGYDKDRRVAASGDNGVGVRSKRTGTFVGGGQLGYNFQTGPLVLGVETDINYADLKVTRKDNATGQFAPYANQRLSWFGTVRPRLGVLATERLMVFGTGGFAYGKVRTEAGGDRIPGVSTSSTSSVRPGWTLGGGLEYAVTDNISVRGDYAYVDLDGKSKSGGSSAIAASSKKNDVKFHVARVGLNYKF